MKYITVGLPPEITFENYFIECEDSDEKDHSSSITPQSTGSGDDPASKLADEFQSKAQFNDDDFADFCKQEMEDPRRRKTWFISHCVLKEVAPVRSMLQQYKEDRLFDCRDRYGDDIMSMVAMEGHVCVMELLHEAGAGVSNVNNRGRTPLMEAALWGREAAVLFLLERGADPRMQDHNGRTALFLAQDTDDTTREREERSPLYINSRDLRSARIRIFARLESFTIANGPSRFGSSDVAALYDGYFRQSGLDLAWYERAMSYDLDYSSRTVGILSYPGRIMAVAAMSGATSHRPHPQTLDNNVWTRTVRDFCAAIGFTSRPDHRDRLFEGSFNACHAEKQLLAYHIDRHFFLGLDLRNSDVIEVGRLRPLGRPPTASIVVNRPVCEDCDAFINHVSEIFGVEVEANFR